MRESRNGQGIVLYSAPPLQTPIVWILLFIASMAAIWYIISRPLDGPARGIGNMEPSWSPDGSKIAFSSDRDGNREIYLVDVNTQKETRITYEKADDSQPAWTRAGDLLAIVSKRDGQRCGDLYLLHVVTGQTTRVTFRPSGCDMHPSWTPTPVPGEISKRVVFDSDRDDGKGEIYSLDIDTFADTRITFREAQQDIHPTISPDGSKIAFQSYVNRNWEIFVMDSDGRNIKQLTFNPKDDIQPAWSPDGQKIAFASHRDGNWEIYVMDTDGSNVRKLTNHVAHDQKPTWSPDSKWIGFQSNRTGRWEIWRMSASDGSNLLRLSGKQ